MSDLFSSRAIPSMNGTKQYFFHESNPQLTSPPASTSPSSPSNSLIGAAQSFSNDGSADSTLRDSKTSSAQNEDDDAQENNIYQSICLTPPGPNTPISDCSTFLEGYELSNARMKEDPTRHLTRSDSMISLSTLSEVSKRKAPHSPTGRPRSQTATPTRPQSMIMYPHHPLYTLQHQRMPQRQALGEVPVESLYGFMPDSPQPTASKSSSFWEASENEQEVLEQYKRQKNEHHNARQSRRASAKPFKKPTLNRDYSTCTLFNNISLVGSNENASDQQQQQQQHQQHQQQEEIRLQSGDQDENTVVGSTFSADENEAPDQENVGTKEADDDIDSDAENRVPFGGSISPADVSSSARQPLSDISADLSTSPPGPFVRLPFGPLMTSQPRKAPTRQRLHVKTPFPMNPFYWDEYSEDTIKYMMEIEGRYDRFKYSFELSSSPKDDRLKFVQMIICLGYEAYRMESTTVHIAVNILDRFFITQMSEKVGHQECLAACLASLVIAIKLEEGRKLSTNDLCHQVLYACSAHEVSQMELHILCALKFEIIVATTAGFCEFFKRGIVQDQNTLDVIDFLCDLSLYSYELLSHNPSQIAACVIWIGLCSSNRDWDEDMAILTGYSRYDLTPCSEIFQELVCHTFRAIKQKPLLQVYPRMSEIMACLKQIMQA